MNYQDMMRMPVAQRTDKTFTKEIDRCCSLPSLLVLYHQDVFFRRSFFCVFSFSPFFAC